MFLSIANHIKSLSLKKAYIEILLPFALVISLCFHKFAAVFFAFAAFGLYILKKGLIKKTFSQLSNPHPSTC